MPSPAGWSGAYSVPLSGNAYIDALLVGARWTSNTITFSFPGYGSLWSTDSVTGYGLQSSGREPWVSNMAPLSTYDQPFFESALKTWAAYANLTFVQVADTSTSVGDIRAAYSYQPSKADKVAWAYFPGNSAVAGDVWFNALGESGTQLWAPGTHAYFAVLHELGHALGLKHPFDGTPIIPTGYDSQIFTIMSYSAIAGDTGSYLTYYPTTPMVLDISAIQYLYGANTSFNSGNNTYSYNDSRQYMETIWDGGGNDSITYSGAYAAAIDLNQGHGSSIGAPVYAISSTGQSTAINNVWIAFGTDIENGFSGSGNDILTGNALPNILNAGAGNDQISGGLGDDTLVGGPGNDVIDGGSGTDIAAYAGSIANFSISHAGALYTVVDHTLAEGTDTVSNVEALIFADKTIDLSVTPAAASVSGTTLKSVIELYIAFFNRVPDSEGMTYWLGQAANGASVKSMADSFYSAAIQYSTLTGYSASMTNADFVSIIYKNVLDRNSVDASGTQYWTTALANGTETRGSLVESILTSAHTFKGDPTWGWVADLLDNKYAVGKLFAIDMGLSFNNAADSVQHGMAIAAAVTPTDTHAAIALIGVSTDAIHIA